MPGPANAGLLIYAFDPARVAQFYESVLGMQRRHQTDELIVLENADIQLLVHAVPPGVRAGAAPGAPPAPRWKSALKFFLTVPSLAAARALARSLGGDVFAEQWTGPGFIVCNAMDCEGNIFHLREMRPPGGVP